MFHLGFPWLLAANVATIDCVLARIGGIFAPSNLPIAVCHNVTRKANARCQAARRKVKSGVIGKGSRDPLGQPLIFRLNQTGPYKLGSNPVRLTVSAGQRTATCNANVEVVDRRKPKMKCPFDITLNTTPATCTVNVAYDDPEVTDNCLLPVNSSKMTAGKKSGEKFRVGKEEVTYEATDAAGNKVSCSFFVTVNHPQDQAPIITCPQNTLKATTPNCTAKMLDFSEKVVKDSCGIEGFTQSIAAGKELKPGVYDISFTATDLGGQAATKVCQIKVVHKEPPSITTTCPASKSINATAGNCTAKMPNLTTLVNATDSCGIATVTQSITAGTNLTMGVYNVTFKVTDASNNTSTLTCPGAVEVVDIEPPSITTTCPAVSKVINATAGDCKATMPNLTTLVNATDSCGNVTVTQSITAGMNLTLGMYNVTFTAIDASNNTFTLTCQGAVNVSCD